MASSSNGLTAYFAKLDRYDLLSREEELTLVAGARNGDSSARDRLIGAHLRYVVRVARRYAHHGLPLEDLINEGNVGLLEATERFDPNRGTRFITCADWWIRRAMINAITRAASLVKVSGSYWRAVREVRDATSALESRLGRAPSRDEIGQALRRDEESVDRLLQIKAVPISLDDPVFAEDPETTGTEQVVAAGSHPDDDLIREESERLLLEAIEKLPERERVVIRQRHGIGGERVHSLKEIGMRLSLSRERVRQIDRHACKRLRWLLIKPSMVAAARRRAAS